MTTTLKPSSSKRLSKLVGRSLRQREAGVKKFNQSRETLQKAISAGLTPDAPVEIEIVDKKAGTIEKANFVLVDNFAKEKSGGWATVNRFDLKKMAKNPRAPKGDPTEGDAEE